MLETKLLHEQRVLWPDMRSLEEVLELKDTTIPHIFETTYQGNPTDPSGSTFKREWWSGRNRYRFGENHRPVGRWISLDTGLTESEGSADSSVVIGDLMPDYTLRLVYCWSHPVGFPDLVAQTKSVASSHYDNGMLRGVVIERKISGISLIQTLERSSEEWLKPLIQGYNPREPKVVRWSEAAVWCSLNMIHLPEPSPETPWLYDFEDDLFNAPNVPKRDRLDAFAQLVLFLSNLLAEGYQAKREVIHAK